MLLTRSSQELEVNRLNLDAQFSLEVSQALLRWCDLTGCTGLREGEREGGAGGRRKGRMDG